MSNKTIYTKPYRKMINLLVQARKEANLTQEQVAIKMGWVHHHYVSKMENCQRRIDVIELAKLAKTYGKSLSYFTDHLESK